MMKNLPFLFLALGLAACFPAAGPECDIGCPECDPATEDCACTTGDDVYFLNGCDPDGDGPCDCFQHEVGQFCGNGVCDDDLDGFCPADCSDEPVLSITADLIVLPVERLVLVKADGREIQPSHRASTLDAKPVGEVSAEWSVTGDWYWEGGAADQPQSGDSFVVELGVSEYECADQCAYEAALLGGDGTVDLGSFAGSATFEIP